MKRLRKRFKSFRSILLLTIACLFSTSCSKDIFNIMTYSMRPSDNSGSVQQNNQGAVAVYSNFTIQPFILGDNSFCAITNKSNKTMIIDLGESYYIFNSQAQRLYSNRITTTYNSGSVGGGLNVGAVTNAVGIGGVVGEIANGVNVGGSKTNGKSVQEIEERFISIPPHSYRNIPVYFTPLAKSSFLKKKGIYSYSEYQSASHEYLFSYTFDSNASSLSIARNKMWLSQIEVIRENYYSPQTKSNQYYSYRDRNSLFWWLIIGPIAASVGLGLIIK